MTKTKVRLRDRLSADEYRDYLRLRRHGKTPFEAFVAVLRARKKEGA